MKYTKFFADLKKDDTDIAGGKGASLGEMINAKIPVPDGFVVLSTTFDKFIKSKKLDTKIQKILASVKNEDSKSGQKASKAIQKLILNETIPTGIKKEIKTCFDKLDSQYVAVRSSATAEDGIEHAWAGQLDTFLNTTQDSLFENIKKCWASLFTERAIFYRFEKGLEKNHISVAVVVQEMVNSEKSGIAFSVHPVTENRDEMIIEAGFGLGEAIVSGSVTPDSFVVSKSKDEIIENFIAVQSKALYKKEAGGNEWIDLEEEKGQLQVISDSEVLELSKIIKRIENHYKLPQDIEWAYADNKFFITQSRPITTLKIEEEKWYKKYNWTVVAKDFNSPFFRNNIWTNFSNLSAQKFNIPKTLLGIKSQNNTIEYIADLNTWEKTHNELVSRAENDFDYINREIIQKTDELGKSFNKWSHKNIHTENLNNKSDEELINIYETFTEKQAELYAHGVLLPLLDFRDFGYIDKNLRDILKETVSEKDFDAYYTLFTEPAENSFAQDQSEDLLKLISKYEANEEWKEDVKNLSNSELKNKYPKFWSDLKKHTQKHGWVYYTYTGPVFNERNFIEFIIHELDSSGRAAAKLERFKENRKKIITNKERFIKNNQLSDYQKNILSIASKIISAKPRRKDYQSKGYFHLEKLHKEFAVRLGCSVEEIQSLPIEKIKKFLKVKQINKSDAKSIYDFHVLIPSDEGYVELLTDNDAREFYSCVETDNTESVEEVNKICGNVAYSGKTTGTVRIINEKKDLEKMRSGDVLVSVATTPSIVPAMKKASAIITDEGGLTCHAAIVSRELEIPCIVGTKNATSILKDGDLVEVDADNGIIKILENSNDLNLALEINPSDYRFIGLWKEDLFPAYFWSSWFDKEKTKELGFDELTTGGALVLKRGDFFLHFETQEAMKSLLNRAIKTKDISLFKNLYKTSNKVCKDVMKKTDKLAQKSPTAKNFEQFVELGRDLMYYWAFGALMSGYIDEHIVNFALSENIPAEDIAQYVEISETELMRQQKELYEFYIIFKKRNWLIRIENDKQNLIKDIKKDKELFKKINTHIKKYGWIEMLNYIGNILNFDRLLTMIGSVKDKKTQKVRKKKVSEDFQFILDIAAFIGYSRQSGAEYSSIFSYKLNSYLNNTANKLNISFREMLYLTPYEIIYFLKEDKSPKSTIEKRQNGNWLIYEDKNEQVKVSDNDTVIKDLTEKMVPKAQKNSTVINGQIGNKGLVKGRVSIVMATDDFYKFKDGDILVTTMTTPDFIILMQKSKAIVTDIGGLLSHASIVSRELDKPCIIGTKFATQILKDGDLVEVDADNGMVRILKRTKK